MSDRSAHPRDEILVFAIAGERCGLFSADVREIVRAVTIVPLPRAPDVVEGVINVRGQLVAVLDLRRRLRLAPKPVEPSDHLVLATAGARVVAIRVDRVHDLVELAPGQLEDDISRIPYPGRLAGVAKLPDGIVLIHDLLAFLSQAEEESLTVALDEHPREAGAPRTADAEEVGP